MEQGKERKPVEQVRMGCLTRTRSAGWSKGSLGVAKTSAAAADAEGASVAAAVGEAILLVVGQVGAELVVAPATLVVGATIQLVVGPIVLAWPLVGLVVAKG